MIDGLIQKNYSGMENMAKIMEALKGNVFQNMGLEELRWYSFAVAINTAVYILENKAFQSS